MTGRAVVNRPTRAAGSTGVPTGRRRRPGARRARPALRSGCPAVQSGAVRAAPDLRPRCGVFLPLAGLRWEDLLARALLVERLGYDTLWLDDHFWFPGSPGLDHLEVWTALSALAARTTRLRLGPLVLCHSYRAPGLLAKMSASLDAVSAGRLQLGLGAGWMEEEYRAFGLPFPGARVRVEQLEETVEILRRLWRDERATFVGRHHSVIDAPALPKPRSLPLVLGGAGDRLLRLAARSADGWNCPNTAWRILAERRERLERECAAVGRDPAEVEVSEQVLVVLGRGIDGVRRARERAVEHIGGFARFDGDCHVGEPEEVAAALRGRAALGVRSFAVMFGDFGSEEQLGMFAADVAPLL